MLHETEDKLILSIHRMAFEFSPEFIHQLILIEHEKSNIIPQSIFENLPTDIK